MSERAKRILVITIFVVIVLVAGFGIWWYFFRPLLVPSVAPAPPPTPVTPSTGLTPARPAAPRPSISVTPGAPGALPSPVAAGGLTSTTALTQTSVLAPSLAGDGSTIQYYNRSDGKFYRILPDGSAQTLSDKVFFNVSAVTWAGDRAQAILEYPDGANILYNFATGRQATLPRHWQNFSFSPRSDGIAFLSLGADQDSRWLAISSPDGSGSRAIEGLGNNADKVHVAWSPNDQVVAFSRTGLPQGANEQEILLIGKNHENYRSLIVNGIGFRPRWSPDGAKLLYSATSADNDWKPQLWIAGATPANIGEGKTGLGLATWADKCAFANPGTIYCAVPTNLPRGAGLYPAIAANTPDQLWKVDLRTGARQLIAIPSEDHTIDTITISNDERSLYFTDKISGQLYKIDLK